MAAAAKKSNVVSIQADPRRARGNKSSTARMQADTLKGAWNHGAVWEDSEVSLIVNGIEKDETTYEMAKRLGRSYYSVMGARAHIGFALRHIDALVKRRKK